MAAGLFVLLLLEGVIGKEALENVRIHSPLKKG